MKQFIVCILALQMIGCGTTVPIVANFPEAPKTLLEKCTELNKTVESAKLSEIAKTVVENYTLYHECSVKNDAWIEWYHSQKQIFESVK
jgi:hypothetical protein